jgi:hypothetical protein
MHMKNYKSLAAASLALVLLAACGSTGLGDVLGGGSNNAQTYEIRGVVDSVDPGSRSVYLTNVSGYTSMLSNGGNGSTARVYFTDQTQVAYQGKTYRPEDLERGDEVTIRVDESGNRLNAETVNVTYDATSGSSSNNYPSNSYPSSTYPNGSSQSSTIRGTVSYVDTSRRTIDLDSPSWISGFQSNTGNSNRVTVSYDNNTNVDVQGRLFPVTNLERGDVVEVQVYNGSGSLLQANRIVLVRDINSR